MLYPAVGFALFNTDLAQITLASSVILIYLLASWRQWRGQSLSLGWEMIGLRQPLVSASLLLLSFGLGQVRWLPATTVNPQFILLGIEWCRWLLVGYLLYRQAQLWFSYLHKQAPASPLAASLLVAQNSWRALLMVVWWLWFTPLPAGLANLAAIERAGHLALIWSIGWLLLQLIAGVEQAYTAKVALAELNDYHRRSLATKLRIYQKILTALVIGLALAASCLLFPAMQSLGTSLLASAGIATGIVGLAANKIIANFFAGLQLALTQPIRINDAVSVEGEFGVVEDISLNYVVVRIWDLRRLVLPINYFLDKPFINYSRSSTDVISQINFFCDYQVPITDIRDEFIRLVSQSLNWDHKTVNLQVTELQENQLKFRGIASAATPGKAWDLRCEILEKLIKFMVCNYPQSLPRLRFESLVAAAD